MTSPHGRVAVLMGGWSSEREISLQSGATVLAALREAGVDAHAVDPQPADLLGLRAGGFDVAFNILHGTPGEDGILQGACALQGLPVTGCGVQASANALDKVATKALWRQAGLPVAADRVVRAGEGWRADDLVEALGLPVFVKPAREGSSVGVARVTSADALEAAISTALDLDASVLVEAEINGPEYTAGWVAGTCLPLIRIEAADGFYDFDAKYVSDATQYHLPAGLTDARETELQALCAQAFAVLGGRGWGRVDFMMQAGEPVLLEANTTPGMTSHSLVPKAAQAHGWDLPELCLRILNTAEVPR